LAFLSRCFEAVGPKEFAITRDGQRFLGEPIRHRSNELDGGIKR
jgi:hypothetical protein